MEQDEKESVVVVYETEQETDWFVDVALINCVTHQKTAFMTISVMGDHRTDGKYEVLMDCDSTLVHVKYVPKSGTGIIPSHDDAFLQDFIRDALKDKYDVTNVISLTR